MLPEICGYYQKANCRKKQCDELHVCFHQYRFEGCLKTACKAEHSLETPRNIELLRRMGWRYPEDMPAVEDGLRRRARSKHIGICVPYNVGVCTRDSCGRLHVCYRYAMVDACPLDDCDLSHDLTAGDHNARILAGAGLTGVTISDWLPKLRSNMREHVRFQPAICTFGWATGCEQRCMRMHCCRDFLRGHCKLGDRCLRTHSLQDPHNQRVLRFFGWTEAQVLSAMASKTVQFEVANDKQLSLEEQRLIQYLEAYKEKRARLAGEPQKQGAQ